MESGLLYLSSHDVDRALCKIDPVAAVAEALTLHAHGQTTLHEESYLAWQNGDGEHARSLALAGFLGGELQTAGCKVINANPGNVERGLPRASGLIVLFDLGTAQPLCLLAAARISALRTAAVSALAVEHLAAEPVEQVAVLGAGALPRRTSRSSSPAYRRCGSFGCSTFCPIEHARLPVRRLSPGSRSRPSRRSPAPTWSSPPQPRARATSPFAGCARAACS